MQTIEGNTSASKAGSQRNGGMVARITRDYGRVGSDWYVLGFVRPKYKTSSTSTTTTTKTITTSSSYNAVITAKSGLNVRKAANTTSKVLATIPYNTSIKITAEKNG